MGSYVATVPVYLKFENRDPRLLPNLTVSADVILRSRPGKAIVPREAIFDAGPGEPPVVYVREEGVWEARDVELGIGNHVVTAIRSGVEPGEVVALENPTLWRSGKAGDS
jgi:multidrug efflux pump subunit AcrA (membrane-fusion protein)